MSDNFGRSSEKIINKILENHLDTSFDLNPLVHGSIKKKLPELELAIDSYITPEQAGKLKIIKAHFEDSGNPESRVGRAYSCVRHTLSKNLTLS